MSKGFKITFGIMVILLFVMIMLSSLIPNSGLDIDTNLRENVPREEIIQALKKDKEYINKEKEKQKKIEKIKENSYFYKLKETGILNENNTINYLNKFQAGKLVKESNTISTFVTTLSTKELIDSFNQMNDKDKISSIIVIVSRNEFKDEYKAQLELANASVLKEEQKTKKEIEEIEKVFNNELNKKVEEKSQIINEQIKYNLIIITLGAIITIIAIIMLIIIRFS